MNYSYTPEEALKVIKHAYDETGSDKFQNNLVESISPEIKQVMIIIKPCFTFDKELIKPLLKAEFPGNKYMISISGDRIFITRKI